ncbi:DUF6151 family protein [Ferrimonas marina]|uniref:CENP-V/GFA domain-containing protein n=1 Tax=Ferrimonas marina TaxID=299255 RepID=A0A1M5RYL9_9GAMM|nr:DUF6151 family protein [Ferrimonas marina]SHH31299.1 hypothetical protein SAMN02745129_1802 [Ferrimonas marina]
MAEVALSCQCGTVQGIALDIEPSIGTRGRCYCADCQRYAEHLGQPELTLDPQGGTDVYQLAPAQIRFTQGQEQIRCLRLSEKGPYRWYAGCCNTPIANTLSSRIPFVGLIHRFRADPQAADQAMGPVRVAVHLKDAKSRVPKEQLGDLSSKRYMIKLLARMLSWKLSGKNRPSPFFDSQGKPLVTPEMLDKG